MCQIIVVILFATCVITFDSHVVLIIRHALEGGDKLQAPGWEWKVGSLSGEVVSHRRPDKG